MNSGISWKKWNFEKQIVVETPQHIYTWTNRYMIIACVLTCLTLLFVGIWEDDEFYEPDLFLKYKPSFHMHFYSPIGMQDLDISDLDPARRSEEEIYREFVVEHRRWRQNTWFAPFILIQLTLTSWLFGIFQAGRDKLYRWGQFLIHSVLGMILTIFGIALVLSVEQTVWRILMVGITIAVNYGLFFILTKYKTSLSI